MFFLWHLIRRSLNRAARWLISKTEIRTVDPDLELVPTRAMFLELSKRYDAVVSIGVRVPDKRGDSHCIMVLSNGVSDLNGFLRKVDASVGKDDIRDLKDGDL